MRRNAVSEVGTMYKWSYMCIIPAHGKLLQEDPKFEVNLDNKDHVLKEGGGRQKLLQKALYALWLTLGITI